MLFLNRDFKMNNNIILLLNGASSSGKTALINIFVSIAKDLFIRMGIDIMWGQLLPPQYIMFNKKSHLGFQFINGENGIETHIGIYGKKITSAYMESMNIINKNGFSIIADDVILTRYDLEKYSILDYKNVFFIGIYCDKDEIFRREKMRGDRPIGLSAGQVDIVHKFEKFYDFTIDNTTGYEQNAYMLLEFIKHNKPGGLSQFIQENNVNKDFYTNC